LRTLRSAVLAVLKGQAFAVERLYTFGAAGIPIRQFPCKELLPCLCSK
jgi:hypothetical protein